MQNRPKRRTLRLPSFDYSSSGAYSITICASKRSQPFHNATLRQILEEEWKSLPQRFPTVTLDSFVIMPDHIHFIVWLGPKEENVASPTLGNVVGALKSRTDVEWSRHLRSEGNPSPGKLWQDRYYDHIIRDDDDLQTKRQYIQNNPLVAQLKKEHHRHL